MLGQGFNDSKLPTIDVEEHDCQDGEIKWKQSETREKGRGKKKKKKQKEKKQAVEDDMGRNLNSE